MIEPRKVVIISNQVIKNVLPVFVLAGLLLVTGCGGEQQKERGTLGLSADPSDSLTIELEGKDSVSVLQLLEASHEVGTTASAMGMFVTRIDSLESSMSAHWLYSVNDTMPQAGCDKAITRNGDRVVWHFRKIE